MLSTAVEDGLVRENVALRLPRVGRPPRQIEPPTREQVESVLAVAAPDARGPILVAASSGLRRGEVFGLRWNDIDFERRLIRVSSSDQDGEIVRPKTKAGERLVPMFGSLRQVLLEERGRSPFKSPDDFVFAGEGGGPRSPNGWLWEFYPALKRAKVRPFRFHDLRHFAVSQLIAQGREHPRGRPRRRARRPFGDAARLFASDGGRARQGSGPIRPLRLGAGDILPSSSARPGASGARP